MRIVVMGVAGCGKSTVGAALAERLGYPMVEGDDLHPPSNIAKMSVGTPLSDDDRWPWLAAAAGALGDPPAAVLSCSCLRRAHRDRLRRVGEVRFVHLELTRAAAEVRVAGRSDHFMAADMVASQFDTLEPPTDEPDVIVVDATIELDRLVDRIEQQLRGTPAWLGPPPLVAVERPEGEISPSECRQLVAGMLRDDVVSAAALDDRSTQRRVLLVPPDQTRLHSGAGAITVTLYEELSDLGVEVWVAPALGTHVPMSADDIAMMFGAAIPADRFLDHDWRRDVVRLGEISAEEVNVISSGRLADAIPIEVNRVLLDGWDAVISVGQVVPHEVIGMANFTKNLAVGLGGEPTIHRSHFLGAVCDMEQLMGRPGGPVREVLDAAVDRFLAPVVPLYWLLTVMEGQDGRVVQRGIYGGSGGSGDSGGTAYRLAAALAARVNVDAIDEPWDRVVCWLDPDEFRTTWLGNKAIYRTRMALADGAELVILAPGVSRFGEDEEIDELIRRHGYRGTAATLEARESDPDLAANLAAAAHLIHGSSEGRFRIVYCTDPDHGGLTESEVTAVGFGWRPLTAECQFLGVDDATSTGGRVDADGRSFHHIAHPSLGLWAHAPALATSVGKDIAPC